MQDNLCIIPARGGSKRIPRKNIKDFLGKPIIAYSIEAAIESGLFAEVMVSTDDLEIADIAKNLGAKVPFLRNPTNSDDFATTADVILEVIESYFKHNRRFEQVCCIYPTAPFTTSKMLKDGFNLLNEGSVDSVLPVSEYGHPIHRSLEVDSKSSIIKMSQPKNINMRSQDLKKTYHDSGQWYWINVKSFLDQKTIFMKKSLALVVNRNLIQDIDTDEDWKLAEFKYAYLQNIK